MFLSLLESSNKQAQKSFIYKQSHEGFNWWLSTYILLLSGLSEVYAASPDLINSIAIVVPGHDYGALFKIDTSSIYTSALLQQSAHVTHFLPSERVFTQQCDWTHSSQSECVPVAWCTLSTVTRKPSITSRLIMWQIDDFISRWDWSLTRLKRAQGNVSMTKRSISASKLSFLHSPDCVRLLTLHRVYFRLSPVKEVM